MNIRKPKTTPTSALIVFLSFWITALAVRGIIFLLVSKGIIPALFIMGYHIHHFITGFILLTFALILYFKKIWSKYIPIVLFGAGMALVFDEFLFWTRDHFNYWSLVNLFALSFIGTILAGFYQYTRKTFTIEPLPLRSEIIQWSVVLLPVLLAFLLLLDWFSYHNLLASETANKIFPRSMRRTNVPTVTIPATNNEKK